MKGYEALRRGAAWIDLRGRAFLLVHGEDRKRLLHAMTTNHVQQLEPGEGCYAFFLNDKGRMIADVNILARPEHLVLDSEPETRALLYEHLDKFIIADDVTLEDCTDETAVVGIEGAEAEGILQKLGAPVPAQEYAQSEWGSILIACLSVTGAPGFRLFAPAANFAEMVSRIEAAGAAQTDAEAVRLVRLENGRPRYGEELSERYLSQETQLSRAMHFSKGCYLGQEIVERVRSRGQVHRHLMRFELDSPQPPEAGTKLAAGGTNAAEIASAAYSPALQKTVGLAYVRTEFARPGAAIESPGGVLTITGLPS